MDRHIVWMIIGCALPLLLLFSAPLFGIDSSITIWVLVIAMFTCHLQMIGHHRKGAGHPDHML